MEIWKDIQGYEGIYQASTLGRIRTIEGKTTYSVKHGVRKWKSRILKYRGMNPTTGNRVSLWKDKACKDWLVARLIARTFIGLPEDKMTVNHKDGNRFNNNVENLEWLSLTDNIRHAFKTGLMPTQKHICLIDEFNNHFSFRSLSQASIYLGKYKAYLSNAILKNRTIKNVHGIVYRIDDVQ
jgi:hypothetical protein